MSFRQKSLELSATQCYNCEVSNGNIIDHSGNNFDMSINGTPVVNSSGGWGAGLSNYIQFKGVAAGDCATVAHDPLFNYSNNASHVIFLRLPSIANDDTQIGGCFYSKGGNGYEFRARYDVTNSRVEWIPNSSAGGVTNDGTVREVWFCAVNIVNNGVAETYFRQIGQGSFSQIGTKSVLYATNTNGFSFGCRSSSQSTFAKYDLGGYASFNYVLTNQQMNDIFDSTFVSEDTILNPITLDGVTPEEGVTVEHWAYDDTDKNGGVFLETKVTGPDGQVTLDVPLPEGKIRMTRAFKRKGEYDYSKETFYTN